MKRIKIATVVAACALSFCGTVLFRVATSQKDRLVNSNVEALSQTEQPNTLFCIYNPDWVCIGLHPWNPELDESRPYAMWW